MSETNDLVKAIIEGIREKKGQHIVVADLHSIPETICNSFVICHGNSPAQVGAIVDSVWECAHKQAGVKPIAIDGLANANWVAMDYADVVVHVFLPDVRQFYNLETLWADARLTTLPDDII